MVLQKSGVKISIHHDKKNVLRHWAGGVREDFVQAAAFNLKPVGKCQALEALWFALALRLNRPKRVKAGFSLSTTPPLNGAHVKLPKIRTPNFTGLLEEGSSWWAGKKNPCPDHATHTGLGLCGSGGWGGGHAGGLQGKNPSAPKGNFDRKMGSWKHKKGPNPITRLPFAFGTPPQPCSRQITCRHTQQKPLGPFMQGAERTDGGGHDQLEGQEAIHPPKERVAQIDMDAGGLCKVHAAGILQVR